MKTFNVYKLALASTCGFEVSNFDDMTECCLYLYLWS